MIRSLTVGVPLEDASSPSKSKQTISFLRVQIPFLTKLVEQHAQKD